MNKSRKKNFSLSWFLVLDRDDFSEINRSFINRRLKGAFENLHFLFNFY